MPSRARFLSVRGGFPWDATINLKNMRIQSSHLLSGVVNTVVCSDARLHRFVFLSQARSHTVYSVFAFSPLAVQVCEPHSIGCEVEDVELR